MCCVKVQKRFTSFTGKYDKKWDYEVDYLVQWNIQNVTQVDKHISLTLI